MFLFRSATGPGGYLHPLGEPLLHGAVERQPPAYRSSTAGRERGLGCSRDLYLRMICSPETLPPVFLAVKLADYSGVY